TFRWFDVVGAAFLRHARDEIGDGALHRAVAPGAKRIGLRERTAIRRSESDCRQETGENNAPGNEIRDAGHAALALSRTPVLRNSAGPNARAGMLADTCLAKAAALNFFLDHPSQAAANALEIHSLRQRPFLLDGVQRVFHDVGGIEAGRERARR